MTADDFGLGEAINNGIVEAHVQGCVTAASLMPTGRAFEHAVALARAHPELDVGVHLTLDEEAPLLQGHRTIVGPDGRFHSRSRLIRDLVARRIDLREVDRSWRAQIERVLETGLQPSFLNGHGHLHVFPRLFPITVACSREYSIPVIRRPVETLVRGRPADMARAQLVTGTARLAFARTSARSPAAFFGLGASGHLDAARIASVLRRLPEGVSELMAHPGRADAETHRFYGHWSYRWEDELRALIEAAVPRETLTTFRAAFAA